MTEAHEQKLDIHLTLYYPEHPPRENDPHYHFFHAAHDRMKKAGLLKCAISGCTKTNIELHHSLVEFALQNGIDLVKFNELYGMHLTDETFLQFIEEEGNLEPLCALHHRGVIGVHNLPEPQWNALRVWKEGLQPPAQKV